uniref:Uncharacterized protein n=1 Tax=Ursus maritimus TaxID=29073 RepID=A0A452U6F2_URSMA
MPGHQFSTDMAYGDGSNLVTPVLSELEGAQIDTDRPHMKVRIDSEHRGDRLGVLLEGGGLGKPFTSFLGPQCPRGARFEESWPLDRHGAGVGNKLKDSQLWTDQPPVRQPRRSPVTPLNPSDSLFWSV